MKTRNLLLLTLATVILITTAGAEDEKIRRYLYMSTLGRVHAGKE